MKIFLYFLITFLIATEGIFSGYKIFGIDIHRLVEGFIFVIIIQKMYYDLQDKNQVLYVYFKYIVWFILLLFLKLFVLTFFKDELNLDIFRDLIRLIFAYIYLYLVYYLLKKDFNFLKWILLLNFPLMLIAFLQFPAFPTSDMAWMIKDTYFAQNVPDSMLGNQSASWYRARVSGLYAFAISLGYIIVSNMLVTIYLYIKEKNSLYLLYFIFLGALSFISLTRSTLVSFTILSLYLLYLLLFKESGKIKKIFISFSVIFVLIFSITIFNNNMANFERVTNTTDNSAVGRIPLLITGLYTLANNPLGVSNLDDKKAKREMYNIYHHLNILVYPSHNGLVQIGFKYTVIGILLFLMFVYTIKLKIFPHINKELRTFFTVALIAYFGTAMFHNAFIFAGDFTILVLLAILAYEYYISKQKDKYNET